MRALCSLMLLTALPACELESSDRRGGGGGSALEGSYAVTAYRSGACTPTLDSAPPPFDWFDVELQEVVTVDSLALVPCESDVECTGAGQPIVYFSDYDDFTASGETQTTTFDGQFCTLEWTAAFLDATESGLVYTSEQYRVSGVDGVDIDDCIEQAEAWTGTRPCVSRFEMDGVFR